MKDMTVDEIIMRIGYFRTMKNMSARELSLQIGKNEIYINHLENKKFNILLPVFLEILGALDITAEEFFSDNYLSYKQDKEILELLKGLPKDRKDSFVDLLKNLK